MRCLRTSRKIPPIECIIISGAIIHHILIEWPKIPNVVIILRLNGIVIPIIISLSTYSQFFVSVLFKLKVSV